MAAKGFTLIELVIVIILLAILAVTAMPKITPSEPFEAHTFRTSLISALRLTQQRAMQQTNSTYCHQIIIESKQYGVPNREENCTTKVFPVGWQPDASGLIVDDNYSVTFQINGVTNPGQISFDGYGVPQDDCDGGCVINVSSASETVQIKIESQGYIYGL